MESQFRPTGFFLNNWYFNWNNASGISNEPGLPNKAVLYWVCICPPYGLLEQKWISWFSHVFDAFSVEIISPCASLSVWNLCVLGWNIIPMFGKIVTECQMSLTISARVKKHRHDTCKCHIFTTARKQKWNICQAEVRKAKDRHNHTHRRSRRVLNVLD